MLPCILQLLLMKKLSHQEVSLSLSLSHPAEFWGDIAKDFFWKTKHTGQFLDYNFDVTKGEIFVKCMEGASTNICYNVLDRNVHERKLGDKVAFYWLVCVCVCVCDSCGWLLTRSLCSGFKVSVCLCVFTVSLGLHVSTSTRTSPADAEVLSFILNWIDSFRFSEDRQFLFSLPSFNQTKQTVRLTAHGETRPRRQNKNLSCDDKYWHTLKSRDSHVNYLFIFSSKHLEFVSFAGTLQRLLLLPVDQVHHITWVLCVCTETNKAGTEAENHQFIELLWDQDTQELFKVLIQSKDVQNNLHFKKNVFLECGTRETKVWEMEPKLEGKKKRGNHGGMKYVRKRERQRREDECSSIHSIRWYSILLLCSQRGAPHKEHTHTHTHTHRGEL